MVNVIVKGFNNKISAENSEVQPSAYVGGEENEIQMKIQMGVFDRKKDAVITLKEKGYKLGKDYR